jgi:hypothetical protein
MCPAIRSLLMLLVVPIVCSCLGPAQQSQGPVAQEDWRDRQEWQLLSSDGKPITGYPLSLHVSDGAERGQVLISD